MSQMYNTPDPLDPSVTAKKSSIDGAGSRQINTEFWIKKALVEAADEIYFGQFADTTAMPKHYGKRVSQYHYLPILDDRNVNDQGINAAGVTCVNGNMFGSSLDYNLVSENFPDFTSETGGRFNRVGVTRLLIEAEISKMGFFTEFDKDSLQFDTDAERYGHMSREMIIAANKIAETRLQQDLVHGAGVVYYAGNATQDSEMTGDSSGVISEVSYADLRRLAITLDKNKVPYKTKHITGTRMIDTKVVHAARPIVVSPDLIPTLEAMVDSHGRPAFVSVEHYAASGNTFKGEIGKIGSFRFIQNNQMMKWRGAGAVATGNVDYYASTKYDPANIANAGDDIQTGYGTEERYDVYPMLVIGDGSFTTTGFQTSGNSTKFSIKSRMPESEGSYGRDDPYGENGFMSIKWYYGTMILRPERLACIKTVARM